MNKVLYEQTMRPTVRLIYELVVIEVDVLLSMIAVVVATVICMCYIDILCIKIAYYLFITGTVA